MRNLLAPHSLPGAEGIVSVATGFRTSDHATVRCDS